MKKIKIKNKKKIKSKILVLLFLIIILFTVIPKINNKKVDSTNIISLIINNEDYTNNLIRQIYLSTNNTVYVSIDDIKKIYDENILLDEEKKEIITTYKTKIAVINIEDNTIRINGTQAGKITGIINESENYYLPISDLKNVYNFEINVFEKNKIIAIYSLDEKMVKGYSAKKISLKEEQKFFSKTIAKIKKDDEIVIIEKYNNGWAKIRTSEGITGYIKQKNIKDEKEIRQKLELTNLNMNNEKKKIIDASKIKDSQINNYEEREKYIEELMLEMIQKEYNVLTIDFNNVKEYNNNLERLIIESKPRLLEYGKILEVINKQ